MIVLGFDVETSGLDPSSHLVTEVGAILWDTDIRRAVQTMGYMVRIPKDAPYDKEAVEETGLTADILAKYGKDSERSLKQLLNMYDQADVICAHNGNICDRPFLRAWMKSHGITDEIFPEDKFWIDTLTDIAGYHKRWNRQLTSLAAYHGFVNPFPHQAVFDVATMLRILDNYDINEVIAYAKIPTIGVRIILPIESKDWAKSHGYFAYYEKIGDREKFRYWMKKIKEHKFIEEEAEVKAAGFTLTKLLQIPEGV